MVVTVKSSHGPIQNSKNKKGKQKQQEDQDVSAEIPLGKYLASTEKPIRDKAVKSLAAFLATGAAIDPQDGMGLLDENEMDKLWKGIFYCFWMSDKPLVQQALASELSELILSIPKSDQSTTPATTSSSSSQLSTSSKKPSKRRKSQDREVSNGIQSGASNRAKIGLAFVNGFWKAMIREWSGLDKYRLDKFYLLMRRFLNASFRFLASEDWNPEAVKLFGQNMIDGGLNPFNHQLPSSITYHISDIYLDELEKALQTSKGTDSISTSTSTFPLLDLLSPFITLITSTNAKITYERVWKNVFEKFWSDSQSIEKALVEFESQNSSKKRSQNVSNSKQKKKRKGEKGQPVEEEEEPANADDVDEEDEIKEIISNLSDYSEIFDLLTKVEGEGKRSDALKKFKRELLKELFRMASRKESNESRRRNIYEFWKENGGDDEEEDEGIYEEE